MTVIAWDEDFVVADKQASVYGTRYPVTKIVRLDNGEIIGGSGSLEHLLLLMSWYRQEMKDPFPEENKTTDDERCWAELVVIKPKGHGVDKYYRTKHPLELPNKNFAVGSGSNFAVGAMAAGASVEEAVQICNKYDDGCGLGVTVLQR